jgi:hypothetical protein
MDNQKGSDKKAKWSAEEQSKIDEALRQAALQAEIEKKLREQRWDAPSAANNN